MSSSKGHQIIWKQFHLLSLLVICMPAVVTILGMFVLIWMHLYKMLDLNTMMIQHELGNNLLEVNKCTFTFSSEIRQIQCAPTDFWCVQRLRPAGLGALDKHQIQASALDLSYFTSKSKYKFINLIHTRQKNKIICSCSWQIINTMALKCH